MRTSCVGPRELPPGETLERARMQKSPAPPMSKASAVTATAYDRRGWDFTEGDAERDCRWTNTVCEAKPLMLRRRRHSRLGVGVGVTVQWIASPQPLAQCPTVVPWPCPQSCVSLTLVVKRVSRATAHWPVRSLPETMIVPLVLISMVAELTDPKRDATMDEAGATDVVPLTTFRNRIVPSG